MRAFLLSLLLLAACSPMLRADVPALLEEVVTRLTDERQRWAFTQLVREYDGDRIAVERLERFDPTRGHDRRWQLIRLNGRAPTPDEAEAWSRKKNKIKKRPPKEVAEYVDLAQARVREETANTIRYEIPFRRSAGGLFPGDKVDLTLTINKRTRTLERAQVSIEESFRVALGLAQIIDIDLDLKMPDTAETAEESGGSDQPLGTASAVVSRLGRRIEYQWSDFTRHDSPPATGQS